MGADSSFLVFIENDATLADAEAKLTASWLDAVRDGDVLVVRSDNGAELLIGESDAPHVKIEAEEIAEWKGVPEIAACTRRFEVHVPDLEASLDDYNSLFETQMILGQLSAGWILLSWNGELLREWE
ncbi:MAG: hypothetical protein KC619_10575 [Myxococcales bacterium]|nr:hypothetical protein [Myxococcales bacterium]